MSSLSYTCLGICQDSCYEQCQGATSIPPTPGCISPCIAECSKNCPSASEHFYGSKNKITTIQAVGIGASIIALLILVWYFFFRSTSQMYYY